LFAEGVKPVEIICRMQAQYSDDCLLCGKIYDWIDHFKKGETYVCDEERSGRPSMSRTENNIQAVERIVWENRHITVDDIAETLFSSGLAYSILLEEEEDFHPMKSHWCSAELVKDTTS
jgi:transposase